MNSGVKSDKPLPLWRSILHVGLIAFATAIAVCFVAVCLLYRTARPFLRIELGDPLPEAAAFVRDGAAASYVEEPETVPGEGHHWLRIRTGTLVRPVLLIVRDTIPPAAEGVEQTLSVHASPTPEKLVKNITDQSVVKLTYEVRPTFGTVGDYTAIIRMEDQSGNETRVPVRVHVRLVRDAVRCEAGEPAPEAAAFLIDASMQAEISEITEKMMHVPGVYPITVTADGETAQSKLIVSDTVAPTGRGVTRIAEPDDELEPEDLVEDIADETEVELQFLDEPDPQLRDTQSIRIALVDLGGNSVEVVSEVLFTNVPPVEVEASDRALPIADILEEGTYETASFVETFVPNEPGTHLVRMVIDGEETVAIIEVVDTEAPRLRVQRTDWFLNTPRDPSFFAAAEDVTAVSLRYETAPDWAKSEQDVTLIASDRGGNEAKQTFTLTLNPDVTPPKLVGVRDQSGYTGEPVAYLSGITAEDICDGSIAVAVDASLVDPDTPGVYPVTYTATDRAGNSVSRTVQITMIDAKVTEERAQEVAQEILAKILTPDMTLDEQLEAIYEYVFRHIRYVSRASKGDWRSEAVRGLTTGRGGCYISYAAMRLLLEQTDAQVLSVERKEGLARHYWLLVNVGSGWYHVDACRTSKGKKRCFMWTTAQTRKVSKTYWKFDESLYPPVATEPYEPKKGN